MNEMNGEIVPAEFLAALEELEEERHISKDMLLETLRRNSTGNPEKRDFVF